MNAQSIWAGQYYAYLSHRPRGTSFVKGARKVRVIRVFKRQQYGNERATTFVEVEDVQSGNTLNVRARDILSFWEDYEAQLNQRLRKEQEDRERRDAENKARIDESEKIRALLAAHGVTTTSGVNVWTRSVTISYDQLRRLLGEEEVHSTEG